MDNFNIMEEYIDVELEKKAMEYSKPIFTGKDILDILGDKEIIKENSNYNRNSFYPSGKKDLKSRKYSIIDSLKFLLFFDSNKSGLSKTNTMKILNYFKKYEPLSVSEKVNSIEYILLGCMFELVIENEKISDKDKFKFFFAIDSEFHPYLVNDYIVSTNFFEEALGRPLILIPFYSHYQVIISQIGLLTEFVQGYYKNFSKDFMHIVNYGYK